MGFSILCEKICECADACLGSGYFCVGWPRTLPSQRRWHSQQCKSRICAFSHHGKIVFAIIISTWLLCIAIDHAQMLGFLFFLWTTVVMGTYACPRQANQTITTKARCPVKERTPRMVYNESSAMTLGRMPDYMGVIKIPADFKHIWSNPRDPCKSIGDEAFKLLVQPKTNFGLPEKLSNRFRMIRMGFRFKLQANGQKHFVKNINFGLLKPI